ncbi:MAG TPA: DUF4115 domain-containing protein [Candidatus Aminicenantes bacterium]|nr:DUF4115 domain-containing protein [Candidatus Aminicenantes bacterium]HRY64507.1 DUF4115 domain-containing protein [Candidatus Aminicenantes bacterium]HRZ71420.1 DUF4115 domain-containing protein [Candidatus Aminicenantes bacterium]
MASLGQALKDQRESRNISLEEIAAATKIVPRYLEALETDRLSAMPSGFFIKGIIRSYAKAVGLDPDEVLDRYRAAGLLGEPEHVRAAMSRRTGRTGPASAPVTLDLFPAETAPPAAGGTDEPLVIEAAPRRRRSPAARRRLFAASWRLLALLAVLAVLIVIWSNRAPRHPQSVPGNVPIQVILPPPQTSAPGTIAREAAAQPGAQADAALTPSAVTAVAAAPAGAAAPPAADQAGQAGQGITIEITFDAETWIHVQTDGQPKIDGIFPAGATATAQAGRALLIHTGNAGGFTFRLNGQPAKRLGRSGQVLTDIKITPENIRDFLEAPSAGPPTA